MNEQKKTLYACLTKHPSNIVNVNNNNTNDKILKAAFLNNIEWPNNFTIKVGFIKNYFVYNNELLDPEFSLDKANWVKYIVEKYFINSGLVNLSFQWDVPLDNSDIRITFVKELGAWSSLGKEALDIDKKQPTMNLGWLDTETDYDFESAAGTGAVVIHEFGHCLGLIHEHSRIDSDLQWNKKYVEKKLGAPPNSWSPEMCEEQIFNQYTKDQFNGSVYDPNSIMHYYFPNEFFTIAPNLNHVTQLSLLDKEYINKKYSGGGGKSIGNIGNFSSVNLSNSFVNLLKTYWYIIAIIILIIIAIIIVYKKK
jgi:serralysin